MPLIQESSAIDSFLKIIKDRKLDYATKVSFFELSSEKLVGEINLENFGSLLRRIPTPEWRKSVCDLLIRKQKNLELYIGADVELFCLVATVLKPEDLKKICENLQKLKMLTEIVKSPDFGVESIQVAYNSICKSIYDVLIMVPYFKTEAEVKILLDQLPEEEDVFLSSNSSNSSNLEMKHFEPIDFDRDMLKQAAKMFFKLFPPAIGSYWYDVDQKNLTLLNIVQHADTGRMRSGFFDRSFTGLSTKRKLESLGLSKSNFYCLDLVAIKIFAQASELGFFGPKVVPENKDEISLNFS